MEVAGVIEQAAARQALAQGVAEAVDAGEVVKDDGPADLRPILRDLQRGAG